MSYQLELAINLKHTGDALIVEREIMKIAYKYGCENSYTDFEFEGKKRNFVRNHLFMIFFFPEEPKHLIKFITYIKQRRNIYIELVAFDNCRFTVLYASKKYLNMMDKYKAKEYLSNRRNINDENHIRIIEAVH